MVRQFESDEWSDLYGNPYNYILDGITDEQERICCKCDYRIYYLEKDEAMGRIRNGGRLLRPFSSKKPIPACDRRICLLDGCSLRTLWIKRLLNQEKLKRQRGTEK